MANESNERMDRIERVLDDVAGNLREVASRHKLVQQSLEEVAARQQYHDEAFERFDSEMKVIREAIAADAENIRALVRVAELHHRRLEHLEGGEAA